MSLVPIYNNEGKLLIHFKNVGHHQDANLPGCPENISSRTTALKTQPSSGKHVFPFPDVDPIYPFPEVKELVLEGDKSAYQEKVLVNNESVIMMDAKPGKFVLDVLSLYGWRLLPTLEENPKIVEDVSSEEGEDIAGESMEVVNATGRAGEEEELKGVGEEDLQTKEFRRVVKELESIVKVAVESVTSYVAPRKASVQEEDVELKKALERLDYNHAKLDLDSEVSEVVVGKTKMAVECLKSRFEQLKIKEGNGNVTGNIDDKVDIDAETKAKDEDSYDNIASRHIREATQNRNEKNVKIVKLPTFSKGCKSLNLIGGAYDENSREKRKRDNLENHESKNKSKKQHRETCENKISSERESESRMNKYCETCKHLINDWSKHVLTRKHIKNVRMTEDNRFDKNTLPKPRIEKVIKLSTEINSCSLGIDGKGDSPFANWSTLAIADVKTPANTYKTQDKEVNVQLNMNKSAESDAFSINESFSNFSANIPTKPVIKSQELLTKINENSPGINGRNQSPLGNRSRADVYSPTIEKSLEKKNDTPPVMNNTADSDAFGMDSSFDKKILEDNVAETSCEKDTDISSSQYYPENVGLYGGEETHTKRSNQKTKDIRSDGPMAQEINDLCAMLSLPALKFECEETIPVICTCYINNKRITTQALLKERALYKANVLALKELSVIAQNFIKPKQNDENVKKAHKTRKVKLRRSEVQTSGLNSTKSKDFKESNFWDAQNIPDGSENILYKLDTETLLKDRNLLGCVKILRSTCFKGQIYEPFLDIETLKDYPKAAETLLIDGSVQKRDLEAFLFSDSDDMIKFFKVCTENGFKRFNCVQICKREDLEKIIERRREEIRQMQENPDFLKDFPDFELIYDY